MSFRATPAPCSEENSGHVDKPGVWDKVLLFYAEILYLNSL